MEEDINHIDKYGYIYKGYNSSINILNYMY